jgi:hypothetical protein
LSSFGSMNGPFLSERDIVYSPRLLTLITTTADNVLIRPLVGAGLLAEGGLAPWRFRTCHTNRGTTFTTTVRMAAWVHCGATYSGPPAEPTITTSLTDLHVAVVGVTNAAESRRAFFTHHAHLATWQSDLGILVFASDQLGGCTC